MSHFYRLIISFSILFFAIPSHAVLPPGATAEDWTLTDLDGNTHNLYSILESGKSVVLDFSATWCPPCWSYHNSGILEDLWENYGPDGTDEIMVFMIEGDGSTNEACLYGQSGCVGGTMGNWVDGTPYPILNLTGADLQVTSDYAITYWPTLYAVCPNKEVYEVGQTAESVWQSWLTGSCFLDALSETQEGICFGEGSIDLTTEGGHGTLSFEWSNGETTEDLNDLEYGFYSVTITDLNGYDIEIEDIFVDGPTTELVINLDDYMDVQCFGDGNGFAEVDAEGGISGYTYAWPNGQTGPILQNVDGGFYTVTVTDANGCIEMLEVIINEPEELLLDAFGYDENCDSSDGVIIAQQAGGTGPFTYDLNGTISNSGYFDNLAAGDYTVIITDANGCEDIQSLSLENIPAPTADAGPESDINCVETEITLDGSGSSEGEGITYLWTTEDGNIIEGENTINPTVDQAGTYQLLVSNEDGTCSTIDEVIIGENINEPTADSGESMVITCDASVVTLNGEGSDSGDNISYLWTTENGQIISDPTMINIDVDAGGTYTIEVTNESNGCSSSSSVEVTVDSEAPVADAGEGQTLNCSILEAILDGTGSDSGDDIQYSWTTENGNIVSGADSNTPTVDQEGQYFLEVTNTSSGCVSNASVVVDLDIAEPDVVLEGDVLNCTNVNIDICATSEDDDLEYDWDGQGTSSCLTVSQPGEYVVIATASNGCSKTFSYEVIQDIALPEANAGEDKTLTCTETSIELVGSGSEGEFIQYMWSTEDGNIVSGGESLNPTVDQIGTYTITVLNTENGCSSQSEVEVSEFINSPVADFDFEINAAILTATSVSEGNPTEWDWSINGEVVAQNEDLNYAFTESGEYEICLNIINECGSDLICEIVDVDATVLSYGSNLVNVSCFGEATGSIEVQAVGGTPDYEISWSGPNEFSSNEFFLTNLEAGIYQMRLEDANGGLIESEFEIEQPAEIDVESTENVRPSCFGFSDGSIEVFITGGNEPYTYEWNTGATTAKIEELNSDIYSVTITDANNCKKSFDFLLNDPTAMGVSFDEVIDETANQANGEITVSVFGGQPPYMFNWSNGETTATISNLEAGEYTCLITDQNGCELVAGPYEVDNLTSLYNVEFLEELSISPNPAQDFVQLRIQLESVQNTKIELINSLGQRFYSKTFDQDSIAESIDVSGLSPGIYFFNVSVGSQQYTEKLLVQ